LCKHYKYTAGRDKVKHPEKEWEREGVRRVTKRFRRREWVRGRITERYIRRVTPKALSRVAGWVIARLRPAVAWPGEKWPGPRRRWAAADCGGAWRNQRDFRRPGTGCAACWRPAPPRTDPVAGWTSIGSTTTSPGHIAPVRAHHTRWRTPHCAPKTDDN